jgi:phosphatidate cytidylyltransferase
MQDLLKRALVVITLGPLTLLLIYLGGWYYFLPFAALLILATVEYARLVQKLGWRSPLWLLIPVVVVQWFLPLPVQRMLFGDGGLTVDLTAPALIIGLLLALCFSLWVYERRVDEDAPGSWMVSMGGLVLLGWLGSHFFRLRGVETMAAQWTALAMLSTWIADSGAYVFGKTLGRHKLSPRLSPNKTVEGYVGGIIAGTLSAVLLGIWWNLPLVQTIVLGLLVSGVSPAGDLGVSLLKRTIGVKDSGHLLPGHGGALDRIDTLIWSVAMVYYLVILTS